MHKPEAHILAIFGTSGDLTRRKLIPAPFDLFLQRLLPDAFSVIGVRRKSHTDDSSRDRMHAALEDIKRDVLRGQYTASTVKGESMKGYREEQGMDPESRTETCVGRKFYIDNWRYLCRNPADDGQYCEL
jgi:glucose-6-phosphate 1-dehydrogenase